MSYAHLTRKNRVELAVLLRAELPQSEIARVLGKHPSTISRELKRNGKAYAVRKAQRKADARRLCANHRFAKLGREPWLTRYVVTKLKEYWSPEQIAGRLEQDHGYRPISYPSIYTFVYNKRPDLVKYLRSQKGNYRRKYGSYVRTQKRNQLLTKRMIGERPDEINTRARLGDWEGDTMVGQERTARLLTYTERKSGYLLLERLTVVTSDTIKDVTVSLFESVPAAKRLSITYDNGHEFNAYELIERETGALVYFCHPYHSWERGTNENTNGLIRQFFPKASPFATLTSSQVSKVSALLNHRPRKRLGFRSPHEVFQTLHFDL